MAFLIDFETGDTTQVSYDGGLNIDTAPTLGGTYCAYVNSTNKYGNIEFTAASEKIIRLKILRKPELNFNSDYESAYFLHLAEGNQTYDAGWLIYLRRFGDAEINRIGVLKSDYSINDEVQVFTSDEVHTIEIDYKAGSGDGHFILKVDDVERFNYGSLNNAGEDMSCLHFGLISGADITGGNLYFDDITDDVGGGAAEIDVGLVTETNSALALSKSKTKDVGLISESDSALSVSSLKQKEVGIISESDTALALEKIKSKDVALVVESDSALNLSSTKTVEVGINTSTEEALPLSSSKIIEIGLITETEFALPVTAAKSKDIEIVTESDTAQSVAVDKSKQIGIISETDTALNLFSEKIKELGLVTENDSALSVSLATDLYNITFDNGIFTSENVFEFDVMIDSENFDLGSYQIAIAFNQSIINGGNLSMELVEDSSELSEVPPTAFCGVINPDGNYELAFASFPGNESITSLTRMGRFRVTNTNPFSMIQPELAFEFSGAGTTIIQDPAFNDVTDQDLFDDTITFVLFESLGIVTETDLALGLSREKTIEISLISESEIALPLSVSKTIEIGIAEELEFAQQLASVLKEYNIGLASEIDTVINLADTQIIDLGLVTETDIALFVKYLNYDPNKLTQEMIKGIFTSLKKRGEFTSVNPVGKFTNEKV